MRPRSLERPRVAELNAGSLSDSACAVPAPVGYSDERPFPGSFALYTNSEGNYFFHEIRHLIASGLEKLQARTYLRSERDGFCDEADFHIVIAPHEFFYLGAGAPLLEGHWPANVVLVNTEQHSTRWFALARRSFGRAQYIWDIDFASAQRNVDAGYPCDYLPLGFVDSSDFTRAVKKLPRHYGTCFLSPLERCRPYLHEPLAERPIDLLFVGSATERREQFLGRAAPILAKHRCLIYLSDPSAPVIPGKNTFLDTPTVLGLAQRSKILLNIHQGSDSYFEWHRIVMQGIWQRTLVVSEPSGVAPPFAGGVDYVEAPLENLPDRIDTLLSTSEGLLTAQAMVGRAYRTLTEECDLSIFLRTLIMQLSAGSRLLEGFRGTSLAHYKANAEVLPVRKQAI